MDIQLIPLDELLDDKVASLNDIVACKTALTIGVKTYSGGSVQDRLDKNRKMVAIIDAELERRTGENVVA